MAGAVAGRWEHPNSLDNLFFSLMPEGIPRLLYIGLSIAAAIIASHEKPIVATIKSA